MDAFDTLALGLLLNVYAVVMLVLALQYIGGAQ